MKRKEFYRSLRKVAHKFYWSIGRAGEIRARVNKNDGYTYCPLEARVWDLIGSDQYTVNGEISSDDIGRIINAADTRLKDMKTIEDKHCRKALLRAVCLEEV